MTYKVSLSRLFKEQIRSINEFDTHLNVKRITQTNEQTAKNLEKMEKTQVITIEPTRIKVKVQNTPYTIVYKVKTNPHKILIVKKILKHR